MKPFVPILCSVIAISGCGALSGLATGVSSPFSGGGGLRGARSDIDGVRFRTRVAATSVDGRGFVTATGGAARDISAAVEAGRVQAVTYCLRAFGGSDIAWTRGPEDELSLSEGTLVLSGACITR